MPETRTPVGEALERAAVRMENHAAFVRDMCIEEIDHIEWLDEYEADARTLRALAEAIGHQPIMFCAEKENPITDHNKGTVRVCGWCAGCRLAALLEGGLDDGR